MESLEFNKLAGGVLGSLLFVVGLGIVTEGMFTPEPPKKPGYDLPSAPEGGAGKEETKEKVEPLANLLAAADPAKGKSDTGVCGACHNFEKGQGPKIGPDLYAVVGRDKGSAPGFAYSDGMKSKGGKWTFEDINEFLIKPAAYVKGTKMNFGGEPDAKKRAEIIAYLNKNSDSPLPLPKPAAAPKEAAKGDAAKPEAAKTDKPQPNKSSEPAGAEKGGKAPDSKTAAGPAGDPAKGKADTAVCGACHNFEKGQGAKVGPNLWGVVGRDKGSFPGFNYSAGMKAKGGKWAPEDLKTFITNPQAYVKGTLMAFAGETSEKKRADIVAYLSTLK